MRSIPILMFLVFAFAGCGGPSSDAPSGGGSATEGDLSEFERETLDKQLADVRAGVDAWNDESVGLCRGQGKECEDFIGESTAPLPPGEYMVHAEFAVPKTQPEGGWKIRFDLECTTTAGEDTSTRKSSAEYDVRYSGTEHGYRLSPLWEITSPNPGGTKRCNYTITAPHPDREDRQWSGHWTIPAA